jgi:4-diphosphocytidyl-2-C-methyl-D-erythritol kinase
MIIIKQNKNQIVINTPAKVNLCLEVLKKRADNYHEIRTLATTIALFDTISLELTDQIKGFKIFSNNKILEDLNKNNCYKAFKILKQNLNLKLKQGLILKIQKRIPFSNGLGGSSTNAAGVLLGLNKLLNLKLKSKELIEIGNQVGSDLGIFLLGGVVSLSGRGDVCNSVLKKPLNLAMIVLKSSNVYSTKESYKNFEIPKIKPRVNFTEEMIKILKVKSKGKKAKKDKIDKLSRFLYNDLEYSNNTDLSYISLRKRDLILAGANKALMSGSGGSVYGIFDNNQDLKKAYGKLVKIYNRDNLIVLPN